MKTFKELLKESRSYRSFDPAVRIPYETAAEWVDHVRYCPSSINLQMLKFCIVTEEKTCAELLANTRWAGKLKDIKLPPIGHAPAAYIVICADRDVIPTAENFQVDVGICAQTILLAACEAGFGGCMIGSFDPREISRILQLSDHLVPRLVLALGRPDETVVLTSPAPDGSVTYYRENGVHYVQKRTLDELLIQ